ncbi:MAG: hypothetical protein ABW175_22985 [Bradyrhizobium sp.]
MLRWMTPILVAMFAAGTAAAQDSSGAPRPTDSPAATKATDAPPAANPAPVKPNDGAAATTPVASPPVAKAASKTASTRRTTVKAVRQLPPGLPRPHYSYRTTVASPAPPRYVRRGRALVVEEEVDVYTQAGVIPFAPGVNGTPLLPGSSTLPGYYGTTHSYSYDGPYYGGPYESYWNRLPYACGVYGYC